MYMYTVYSLYLCRKYTHYICILYTQCIICLHSMKHTPVCKIYFKLISKFSFWLYLGLYNAEPK